MKTELAQQQQQTKLLEDRLTARHRATPQHDGPIGPGPGREAGSRHQVQGPDGQPAPSSGRIDHAQQQFPANAAGDSLSGGPRPPRRRRDPHRVAGRPALRAGQRPRASRGDEHDCRRGHRDPPHLSRPASWGSKATPTAIRSPAANTARTTSFPPPGPWPSTTCWSTASAIKPEQLFVVGHGANHPVVSNGTLEGKQRNRRVELVIYPDRLGQ